MQVQYLATRKESDLIGILELQQANHRSMLSDETKKEQGFVTVQHDLDILSKMSEKYPQIVAKSENLVIGYALVMPKEFRNDIELLKPLFQTIDEIDYQNEPLAERNYFVMGQVCVHQNFRSIGVFDGLYAMLKQEYEHIFDIVVTEISVHNKRSQNAHKRVGFKEILTHEVEDGEGWKIVVWDWK